MGDRERDLERLVAALADTPPPPCALTGRRSCGWSTSPRGGLPTRAEAFYADKKAMPLEESRSGRICPAEFVIAYPPGIPILAPGSERMVTRDILDYIRYAMKKNCMLLSAPRTPR